MSHLKGIAKSIDRQITSTMQANWPLYSDQIRYKRAEPYMAFTDSYGNYLSFPTRDDHKRYLEELELARYED